MAMQINWKWPHTKRNGLLPWYMIAKNMLAVPFIAITVMSFVIAQAIVHGPKGCITRTKQDLFGQ